MGESIFLISDAKKAFNCLRQAFIKASILQYFDLECYIRIETNISSYDIDGVLSQPTFNQVILDSESNLTKFNFGQ